MRRIVTKQMKTLILLGDSTLDNVLWVPNQAASVAGHLASLNYKVINWAADGFTTEDVLHGNAPVLSRMKRLDEGDPFPPGGAEFFAPLTHLESYLQKPLSSSTSDAEGEGGDSNSTSIVLSVGGNDIRHILRDMSQVSAVISSLQSNYAEILTRIQTMPLATGRVRPQLILNMQYRPGAANDAGFYGVYEAMSTLPGPGTADQKMKMLMQAVYHPILAFARQMKLPLIDLPNTFNIHDATLYECQIEPGVKGGSVIASLIHHVVHTHRSDHPSTLYAVEPSKYSTLIEAARMSRTSAGTGSDGGSGGSSGGSGAAVTSTINSDTHHWCVYLS